MKLMRTSLRTLMVIVGLTAVDLAVIRAFWGSRYHLITGIVLNGLVLHAGLFLLIRGRRKARAFWAGFLLAGLLAAGSFVWAMTYPKLSATFVDVATGKLVTITTSGGPLSDEWDGYLNFVERSIEGLPDHINPFLNGKLAEMLVDASIAFAPQLTAALAGGLLCWLMAIVARAAACAAARQSRRDLVGRVESAAR
jgi:hypothetical protein